MSMPAPSLLKICLVHNAYGIFSGEEAVVNGLERLLLDQGHEVIPFTRSSVELETMRWGKIRAFFSGVYNPASRRAMRRLLEEKRPDLVHVHNLFPLISPSILPECRRAGVPVVMTIHNFRLICPNGLHLNRGRVCEECCGGREFRCVLRNCENSLFKSLGYALRTFVARKLRFFLDNVSVYCALTDFARRRYIADGFPADRIVVIPNMAQDAERVEPAAAVGDYVAFVGRLSPEKDIPSLLEAARQCPDIPFQAAGDYNRMPHLPDQAPPNFRFLGRLDAAQLGRFYNACRMLVLPSVCFEGFPTVFVEAMLRGKPIVSSRIGGLPEIVDDGRTGLLFTPGASHELADRIRRLWDHPDQCRAMGMAGRAKALEQYSPRRYYELLTNAYAMALQKKAPGHRP
ncbi:MAG: glycosyltransferase family 4 protein [Candidatus Sumerlaeota bacterium]|nr:glycosyltransferase family 4 protein [Candidatus Sumerlaeota bacterium]